MRLLFVLALLLSAPAYAAETVNFSRASVIAAARNMPSAGVSMVIVNDGADDKITGVRSTAAIDADLRATDVNETGGIISRKTGAIAIPGGGKTTTLNVAGDYISLNSLTRDLKGGETVPVMITFEKAGEKTVNVDVVTADEFIRRFPPEMMGANLEKSRLIHFSRETETKGSLLDRMREKLRGGGDGNDAGKPQAPSSAPMSSPSAQVDDTKRITLTTSGGALKVDTMPPAPKIPVAEEPRGEPAAKTPSAEPSAKE